MLGDTEKAGNEVTLANHVALWQPPDPALVDHLLPLPSVLNKQDCQIDDRFTDDAEALRLPVNKLILYRPITPPTGSAPLCRITPNRPKYPT